MYLVRGLAISVPADWRVAPAFFLQGQGFVQCISPDGAREVDIGPTYPLPAKKAREYVETLPLKHNSGLSRQLTGRTSYEPRWQQVFGRLMYGAIKPNQSYAGLGMSGRQAFGLTVPHVSGLGKEDIQLVTRITGSIVDARGEGPALATEVSFGGLHFSVPSAFDLFLDSRKPKQPVFRMVDDQYGSVFSIGKPFTVPTTRSLLKSMLDKRAADKVSQVARRRKLHSSPTVAWSNNQDLSFYRWHYYDVGEKSDVVDGYVIQGRLCAFVYASMPESGLAANRFERIIDRAIESVSRNHWLGANYPLGPTWNSSPTLGLDVRAYYSRSPADFDGA